MLRLWVLVNLCHFSRLIVQKPKLILYKVYDFHLSLERVLTEIGIVLFENSLAVTSTKKKAFWEFERQGHSFYFDISLVPFDNSMALKFD